MVCLFWCCKNPPFLGCTSADMDGLCWGPMWYGKWVTSHMESHPVWGVSQIVTLFLQGLRLCVRKQMWPVIIRGIHQKVPIGCGGKGRAGNRGRWRDADRCWGLWEQTACQSWAGLGCDDLVFVSLSSDIKQPREGHKLRWGGSPKLRSPLQGQLEALCWLFPVPQLPLASRSSLEWKSVTNDL